MAKQVEIGACYQWTDPHLSAGMVFKVIRENTYNLAERPDTYTIRYVRPIYEPEAGYLEITKDYLHSKLLYLLKVGQVLKKTPSRQRT